MTDDLLKHCLIATLINLDWSEGGENTFLELSKLKKRYWLIQINQNNLWSSLPMGQWAMAVDQSEDQSGDQPKSIQRSIQINPGINPGINPNRSRDQPDLINCNGQLQLIRRSLPPEFKCSIFSGTSRIRTHNMMQRGREHLTIEASERVQVKESTNLSTPVSAPFCRGPEVMGAVGLVQVSTW